MRSLQVELVKLQNRVKSIGERVLVDSGLNLTKFWFSVTRSKVDYDGKNTQPAQR